MNVQSKPLYWQTFHQVHFVSHVHISPFIILQAKAAKAVLKIGHLILILRLAMLALPINQSLLEQDAWDAIQVAFIMKHQNNVKYV